VVVERERSVAGDVLWRKGHIDLDWRKRASMLVNCAARGFRRVVYGRRVVEEGKSDKRRSENVSKGGRHRFHAVIASEFSMPGVGIK
jgi:hypothetical protein